MLGPPSVDAVRNGPKQREDSKLETILIVIFCGALGAATAGWMHSATERRNKRRYYYWTASPSRAIKSSGNVVIPSDPSALVGHSLRSRSR